MLYDVRVVRLIKTTSENPVNVNRNADYICLGHFDMMQISNLGEPTKNPLIHIQDDRNDIGEGKFGCTENHVYSLYLLKNVGEDLDSLNIFWESEKTYTVVTRIHCDYPSEWKEDKPAFSKTIETYCRTLISPKAGVVFQPSKEDEKSCIISFESAINSKETTRVDCIFYDSLELGDTVSILKSNSIAAILEVIRCLSLNCCVRDTYTYCGIRREILQNNDKSIADCVVKNAELSYISTRFSIRDMHNANIFLSKLVQKADLAAPQFFVTGTADQSIHWGGTKEIHLLAIMRALTQEGDNMHYCFNDVITRIGIKQIGHGNPSDQIIKKNVHDITTVMPHYQHTMKWLRQNKSLNWKFTLLKLLGTLEAMYTNYVMDDLANLLIPSVSAFLDRLDYLRNQHCGIVPEKYDEEIIDFLNHWTSLTNDISLLESQLTQHPELSPVRYYIPAMILQFELRFVAHCCKALSIDDCRSFVPMLLPVDSPDLGTYCPLDPRQEEYKRSCPLLVLIPFTDLYRPWETAFRVSHEIAHYCEDNNRQRTKRHQMLVECAATFIVKYWYEQYIIPSFGEDKDLYEKTIEYASHLNTILTNSIESNFPNDQWYLSQSIDALSYEALSIIPSHKYLEQYLFNVKADYFFEKQVDYKKIRRNEQSTGKSLELQQDFDNYLKLLQFLCAECYADISMVLLLNCDFMDYFTSVYSDEYLRFTEQEPEIGWLIRDPYVMRQVARMALVIYAVCRLNEFWLPDRIKSCEAYSNPLVRYSVSFVFQYTAAGNVQLLSEKNLIGFVYISSDDFKIIGDYLEECAKLIQEDLKDGSPKHKESVVLVREGIKYVQNDSFDWEKIQKYILS